MTSTETPAADEGDDAGAHATRVAIHEGSIGLPRGFEDRTANIFVPANTQVQPNLSIARDWLRDDETLSSYIDRQLGTLRSQFAGHKLIERQPCTLGQGEAALQGERIDDSYKNGKLTIYKRQAAFIVGLESDRGPTGSPGTHLDGQHRTRVHRHLRGVVEALAPKLRTSKARLRRSERRRRGGSKPWVKPPQDLKTPSPTPAR